MAKWKKLRADMSGESRSSSREGSEKGEKGSADSEGEEEADEPSPMHNELKKMQARLETTLKQRVSTCG